MSMNITLDDNLDLVCSLEDGGWYIQDYPNDRVSIIYELYEHAINAYESEKITWEAAH